MNYLSFWNRDILLRSHSILLQSGQLTCQKPTAVWALLKLWFSFSTCHFLRTVCNKGDRLLGRRTLKGNNEKKGNLYWKKEGKKGKEIHQRVVIWRWRKHKSWQWSITLIWAAADTVLRADALSAADKGNSDKEKLVWEMWPSEDFFLSACGLPRVISVISCVVTVWIVLINTKPHNLNTEKTFT